MWVERMKQSEDISALSRELDIDRRLLYRWRDQHEPPGLARTDLERAVDGLLQAKQFIGRWTSVKKLFPDRARNS